MVHLLCGEIPPGRVGPKTSEKESGLSAGSSVACQLRADDSRLQNPSMETSMCRLDMDQSNSPTSRQTGASFADGHSCCPPHC